MALEIICETHSPATDNEIGFAMGWLPGQLSETGRRLAHELGERRRGDGIVAVFVSDPGRAVEIAFSGSGIPIYWDATEAATAPSGHTVYCCSRG